MAEYPLLALDETVTDSRGSLKVPTAEDTARVPGGLAVEGGAQVEGDLQVLQDFEAENVSATGTASAGISTASKHSRVGRRFQFDYLTGNASSVDVVYAATQKEAVFQVGDTIEVSAYSPASPKCPAVWECTATDAELPDGANAGDIRGAAAGTLYVANPAGGHYAFRATGTDVRQFGMSTSNSADENFLILEGALSYETLDFREIYPIRNTRSINAPPDFSIAMISSNKRGGLRFEVRNSPNGNYYNYTGLIRVVTAGTIVVDGMAIQAPPNDACSLFASPLISDADSPEFCIERMEFTNNKFSGRVQAVCFRGHESADPDAQWFGVRNFIFRGNDVDNPTANSILMRHIPHDLIVVEGNRVKNLDVGFCRSEISNGTANIAAVTRNKKRLIFRNNEIKNDDEYWATNSTYSYLVAAIFEGMSMTYSGNTFSGVKTQQNVRVYDIYFIGLNLEHVGNTYENCGSFTDEGSNGQRNVLLKSKGGGHEDAGFGTIKYAGNTVKITSEWLAAIGKTAADIYHDLYELPDEAIPFDVDISGNTIELAGLRSTWSSLPNIREYRFSGTTVKAAWWRSYAGSIAVARPIAFRSHDVTDAVSVTVTDNTLVVGVADETLHFIQAHLPKGVLKVANNTVVALAGSGEVYMFSRYANIDQLEIGRNVLRGPKVGAMGRTSFYANTINGVVAGSSYPGESGPAVQAGITTGFSEYTLSVAESSVVNLYVPSDISGRFDPEFHASIPPSRVFIAAEIMAADGTTRRLSFSCVVWWDADDEVPMLQFTDADDNVVTTTPGSTVVSNVRPKQVIEGSVTPDISFTFQDFSSSDGAYFRLGGIGGAPTTFSIRSYPTTIPA